MAEVLSYLLCAGTLSLPWEEPFLILKTPFYILYIYLFIYTVYITYLCAFKAALCTAASALSLNLYGKKEKLFFSILMLWHPQDGYKGTQKYKAMKWDLFELIGNKDGCLCRSAV